MPAPTFGVTAALLEERFWGGTGISGVPRLLTMANDVIAELAGDLETALGQVGVEGASVLEVHAPKSYRWLQATLLYGVQAEYCRRATREELASIEAWDKKFRDRIDQLVAAAHAVLPDASEFKSKGSVAEVIV